MAESSARDTLRHLVLKADQLVSDTIDKVAGALEEGSADEEVIDRLDAIRLFLFQSLAEQFPGIKPDGIRDRYPTAELFETVHTYDDGEPVVVTFDDVDGFHWQVFPRLEPELLDPLSRLAIIDPVFAAVVANIKDEDG